MTRVKAIAIAAITTLIFGSVAIGIAANTGNDNTTTTDAITSAPADTAPPAPATNVSQPVQQPVLVDLTTDDDDDSGRDYDGEDDSRGRDHEEDD
jgi:hypothetical protein